LPRESCRTRSRVIARHDMSSRTSSGRGSSRTFLPLVLDRGGQGGRRGARGNCSTACCGSSARGRRGGTCLDGMGRGGRCTIGSARGGGPVSSTGSCRHSRPSSSRPARSIATCGVSTERTCEQPGAPQGPVKRGPGGRAEGPCAGLLTRGLWNKAAPSDRREWHSAGCGAHTGADPRVQGIPTAPQSSPDPGRERSVLAPASSARRRQGVQLPGSGATCGREESSG
jgi:hypothetical protein